MAATVTICEDNGTATGSPPKGTTRHGFGADTDNPTNCNWKTADDSGAGETAASAAPMASPGNSREKWQYLRFAGTFTRISNVRWTCHHNVIQQFVGAAPFDIHLMGAVLTTYTTPSTSINANLTTEFTAGVSANQGLPVLMSTTGPEAAAPTAELTAAGYTQYLVSQVQVDSGAAATSGYSNIMTQMVVWDEE